MDVHNKVSSLYIETTQGYFSLYGIDLIIAMTIIYIFSVATTYFYVINHIPQLREKWPTEKCNPLYLPFASLVVENSNKTSNELIEENFQSCITNILTSVAQDALKPIYYITNVATKAADEANNASNAIRSVFNRVRNDVKAVGEDVFGRVLSISIPFVEQTILMKNMLAQMHALFTTSMFVAMGTYTTLYSAIMTIINIIITVILLALGISILAVVFIPFIGWALALIPIGLFVAIVIFMMPIVFMMMDAFKGPAIAKPHAPP